MMSNLMFLLFFYFCRCHGRPTICRGQGEDVGLRNKFIPLFGELSFSFLITLLKVAFFSPFFFVSRFFFYNGFKGLGWIIQSLKISSGIKWTIVFRAFTNHFVSRFLQPFKFKVFFFSRGKIKF